MFAHTFFYFNQNPELAHACYFTICTSNGPNKKSNSNVIVSFETIVQCVQMSVPFDLSAPFSKTVSLSALVSLYSWHPECATYVSNDFSPCHFSRVCISCCYLWPSSDGTGSKQMDFFSIWYKEYKKQQVNHLKVDFNLETIGICHATGDNLTNLLRFVDKKHK